MYPKSILESTYACVNSFQHDQDSYDPKNTDCRPTSPYKRRKQRQARKRKRQEKSVQQVDLMLRTCRDWT